MTSERTEGTPVPFSQTRRSKDEGKQSYRHLPLLSQNQTSATCTGNYTQTADMTLKVRGLPLFSAVLHQNSGEDYCHIVDGLSAQHYCTVPKPYPCGNSTSCPLSGCLVPLQRHLVIQTARLPFNAVYGGTTL
jgi:hypothetical protein